MKKAYGVVGILSGIVVAAIATGCSGSEPEPSAEGASLSSSVPLAPARRGDRGAHVQTAAAYLQHFGYLGRDGAAPDTLDDRVSGAVRRYQAFFSLPQTGDIDEATLQQMKQPRCGMADLVESGTGPSKFEVANPWPRKALTYAFLNTSGDLPAETQKGAVRAAFASWAAVTPLAFKEQGSADFVISFEQVAHKRGASDSSFGATTIAHAFLPSCAGDRCAELSGDLHFNDELFAFSTAPTPAQMDLQSVAVHELGHALGLEHSKVPTSVMYPSIAGGQQSRALAPDDVAGIQALYGASAAPKCGDARVDPDEECDDGNTERGDGCSGACKNEPPPPVPPDVNCLFDAVEVKLATRFSPAGTKTGYYAPYWYRFYAQTNTYLGVSSKDMRIASMAVGGELKIEGAFADWLAQSGCGSSALDGGAEAGAAGGDAGMPKFPDGPPSGSAPDEGVNADEGQAVSEPAPLGATAADNDAKSAGCSFAGEPGTSSASWAWCVAMFVATLGVARRKRGDVG